MVDECSSSSNLGKTISSEKLTNVSLSSRISPSSHNSNIYRIKIMNNISWLPPRPRYQASMVRAPHRSSGQVIRKLRVPPSSAFQKSFLFFFFFKVRIWRTLIDHLRYRQPPTFPTYVAVTSFPFHLGQALPFLGYVLTFHMAPQVASYYCLLGSVDYGNNHRSNCDYYWLRSVGWPKSGLRLH